MHKKPHPRFKKCNIFGFVNTGGIYKKNGYTKNEN